MRSTEHSCSAVAESVATCVSVVERPCFDGAVNCHRDDLNAALTWTGVLKCAHPWPGRLPNPVETVKTTYNGRTA
eukprot:5501089-Prymnesium_polylepis.1